jgi:hypothetical protein
MYSSYRSFLVKIEELFAGFAGKLSKSLASSTRGLSLRDTGRLRRKEVYGAE